MGEECRRAVGEEGEGEDKVMKDEAKEGEVWALFLCAGFGDSFGRAWCGGRLGNAVDEARSGEEG